MATKKIEKQGKENEAKKKRETGELKASPKIYYEVIDVHLLQTEAYICSEKGKLKKQYETTKLQWKGEKPKWSRLNTKTGADNFRYAQ